jgi:crotonobetainyl-CoA:carnitine CoA-transferase CaiB-like acyl-CoA transferase
LDVLAGIKVVDVSAWAFVPGAGGVLAHWGADVVKVESPHAPDPMRTAGGSLEPGRASLYFKHYSRGKRSIAIDLAREEGQEILYKLAAEADVFLTSYLPATRNKLNIDVADIKAVNPTIIYARGTGHGPRGGEAQRGGYDAATWWCRGTLAQSTMDVSGAQWPSGPPRWSATATACPA